VGVSSLTPQYAPAVAAVDEIVPFARRFELALRHGNPARAAFIAVNLGDGPSGAARPQRIIDYQ
jgi:hypothetical protein